MVSPQPLAADSDPSRSGLAGQVLISHCSISAPMMNTAVAAEEQGHATPAVLSILISPGRFPTSRAYRTFQSRCHFHRPRL
jgi:hypothetical protein